MFDPLKSARKLEDVGFTREQAEANVELMTELMQSHLATKQDMAELKFATQKDIAELRRATQSDIAELRSATQNDIAELRSATQNDIADLKHELKQLEYRMTIRLGTIVCLGLTAIVALSRLGFLGISH